MRERGKRGASRRIVSVLLAVLLLVTSIPMDGVYAAEANNVQNQVLTTGTDTANIGEATNDATSDKTNENTSISGVGTPVDETSEKGGEESPAGDGTPGQKAEVCDVPESIEDIDRFTIYVKDATGAYVEYKEASIEVGTEIWFAVVSEDSDMIATINGSEATSIEVEGEAVSCYHFNVVENFEINIEGKSYDEDIEEADLSDNDSITLGSSSGSDVVLSVDKTKSNLQGTVNAKVIVDSGSATTWSYSSSASDVKYELNSDDTSDSFENVVVEVYSNSDFLANVKADEDNHIVITKDVLKGATASETLALKIVDLYDNLTLASAAVDSNNAEITGVTVSGEISVTEEATSVVDGKIKNGATASISTLKITGVDSSKYVSKVVLGGVTVNANAITESKGVYTCAVSGITVSSTVNGELTCEVTLNDKTTVSVGDVTTPDKLYGKKPEVKYSVSTDGGSTFNSVTTLASGYVQNTQIKISLKEDQFFKLKTVSLDGKTTSSDGVASITGDECVVTIQDGKTNVISYEVEFDPANVVILNISGTGYTAKLSNETLGKANAILAKTAQTIKIAAESPEYRLDSVTQSDGDSHTATIGQITTGSCDVTIPQLSAPSTLTEVNLAVKTTQGKTLTIKKSGNENIDGIYNEKPTNSSSRLDDSNTESSVFIPNADSTTLYIKLTNGAKFGILNNFVTVTKAGETKGTDLRVSSLNGKADDDVWYVSLGQLTADTTVDIKVSQKTGHKITFTGSNYTATVNDENDITNTESYKSDYPYIGDFVEKTSAPAEVTYKTKTIVLTANDGYRFTSVDYDGAKYSEDGREITITGVTPDDFNDDNVLNIEADTEATVNLTITKESGTDYTVVVGETAYAHHTTEGVVDETSSNSGIYPVSTENEITVKVTLVSSPDKTTHKVASMILTSSKANAVEIPLTIDDTDGDNGVYTASFTLSGEGIRIAENATLTIKTDLSEKKLQGILFVKEHYSVTSTSNSDLATSYADFGSLADIEEGLEGALKLLEKPVSANTTVTFNVNPETNFTIKQISYDDVVIYDVNEDAADPLEGVDGIAVTKPAVGSKDVTIEITAGDALLVKAEQKKLTVVTQAEGLSNNEISGKSFSFVELPKVYAEGSEDAEGETQPVFFDPATELFYTVGGSVTVEDGVYSFLEGADYIDFTVTAADTVEIKGLKFYSDDDATKDVAVVADRTENTFRVAAKALLTVKKIKAEYEVKTEDISFQYNKNLVSVTATGAIKDVATVSPALTDDGVVLTDGTVVKTYKVKKGEKIDVTVEALGTADARYAKLTSVDGQDFTDEESAFTMTANEAKRVVVKAEALTFPIVENNSKEALTPEDNGTYAISYGSYYYAYVKKGNETLKIDGAEMIVDGTTTDLTKSIQNGTTAKFYPEEKQAGKEATVNLKCKNESGTLETVATFKFVIAKVLTEVEVEGVVNNVLTQTVDTTVRYAIDIPEGTSINDLSVDATGCKATIDSKKSELVVTTTAAKAKEKAGSILLVNGRKTLKTITVNTEAVVGVTKATPSVTYVASTTTSIKVQLAAAGVPDVDLVAGTIAYKVDVTAQKGSAAPKHKTFYVPKVGDTTEATLRLFDNAVEKEGKYDVSVQLVQLVGKVDPLSGEYQVSDNNATTAGTYVLVSDSAKEVIDQSAVTKVTGKEEFAVKPSYYTNADELKLDAITSVVYSGQENVVIANVDFGTHTSHIEGATVSFKDAKGSTDVPFRGKVEFNKLYVSIPCSVTLGTYTVVVTAPVPADENGKKAVPAIAEMDIKVEQGVYNLEIVNAPNTFVKTDKKSASFTATALLNGSAKAKVKNKNVIWEIYKNVEGDTLTPITEKDALYGMVTVKNGKVTVDKSYPVSSNVSKNTFYLVATSEANPDAWDYAKVVITNEAAKISDANFILAEYVDGKFVPLSNQELVTSDKLLDGNVYIIAVKDGLKKSSYTADNFLTTKLTVKPSNKKLSVYTDKLLNKSGESVYAYHLTTSTTMKNVKVSFTTMDGGKSTAKKVFTVDYASMDNMVMRVNDTVVSGSYKFVGTSEDVVVVELGYKDKKGEFQNFEGLLNAKVAIKNGKILSSDLIYNTYIVKLNKEEAVITVSNKADKKATPLTCSITNTAYNAFSKTSAPAVTADVKQINAYSVDEQQITYTFKKAAGYKYVKVQIDEADYLKLYNKSAYGDTIYDGFCDAIELADGWILPIENNNGKESFTLKFAGNTPISAGAYKVFFTYGDYKASEFVPATKAGKVAIKAVESKKAEYDMQTAYTMSLLDSTSIALNANVGKNTTVKFKEGNALSTIVNGQPNAFGDLFTVNKDGELTLKSYDVLKAKEVTVNKKKTNLAAVLETYVGAADGAVDDLTGYVEYRVNGSSSLEKAKVTVKLSKDALKSYTASDIKMLAGGNVTSEVQVLADNKEVEAKAAKVSKGTFTAKVVDGKVFVSSPSSAPSVGTSTIGVKVVPSTSFYANVSKVDTAKYGIEVPVTVDAQKTYSPVVNIESTSVAFDTYNGSTATYVANIPYTSNIANKITKKNFKFVESEDSKLASYLTLTTEDDAICLNMTQQRFADAVKAGLVTYGDTKSVNITVSYCNLVEETYKIDVTFPGKASVEVDATEIFTNIRKAVWKDITGGVTADEYVFPGTVDFTEALEAKANKADATKVKEAYEKAAKEAVVSAVKAQLVVGANVAVDADSVVGNYTTGNVAVTVAVKGSDVTSANVNDSTSDKDTFATNTYTITTNVVVDEASDVELLYKVRLNNFVDSTADNYLNGLTVDNTLTVDRIVEAANAYVLADASSIYGIFAEAKDDNSDLADAVVLATSTKAGSVEFTLVLKKKADVIDTANVDVSITRLQNAAEAASAFANALKDASKYFNASTTEEDIRAIAYAVRTNENIEISYAQDGAFEFTTKEVSDVEVKTGIKAVLEFKEGSATPVKSTVNVEFKFDGRTVDTATFTLATLKVEVDKVIGDNTLANKYFTNDSETSRLAIQEAAQKAIGNAPYKVSIEAANWNWEKSPSFAENGSVEYKISFTNIETNDVLTTDTYPQTVFAKDDYQSFAEAKAEIRDNFLKVEDISVWMSNTGSANTFDANKLLADIRKSVKDGYKVDGSDTVSEDNDATTGDRADGRYMTVNYVQVANKYFTAYEDDCNYTAATLNEVGRIEANVILKEWKYDAVADDYVVVTEETFPLNKMIDPKTQDFDAAKKALDDLKVAVTSNSVKFTSTTSKYDVEEEVEKIIQKTEFSYQVTTPVTNTTTKKTSCDVTITSKSDSTKTYKVTLKW